MNGQTPPPVPVQHVTVKSSNGCLVAIWVLFGLLVLGLGGCMLVTKMVLMHQDEQREKEKAPQEEPGEPGEGSEGETVTPGKSTLPSGEANP